MQAHSPTRANHKLGLRNDVDTNSPGLDQSPLRISPSSSSAYSMDADDIDMENHSACTPKGRRTSFSTESSGYLVPVAKPRDDRCLLTDRPVALERCHLVAHDVDDETVRIQS